MGEIIFEKSRKNLKKIYNRIQNYSNIAQLAGEEEVLYLAMGGYNRTYELLQAMGLKQDEIATFSTLSLTPNFLTETHMKKVIYIRKINYVTSAISRSDFSKKGLDINIADGFEESMLIYKTAKRSANINRKRVEWVKPTIVVLDDQSLNLQFGGHRFYYHSEIGFVQVRNRNVSPTLLLDEIAHVEEAKKMMFALYQENGADEAEVLDALNRLRVAVEREIDGEWYLKPTEFKKVVGSNELATAMRELPELSIYQLKSNKKIGKENARWVVVPEKALNFKGFSYKDEDELFEEELRQESESEQEYAERQQKQLDSILFQEFSINIQTGYTGGQMNRNASVTLHDFLNDVDAIEQEKVNGITLLSDATTEEEYNNIKKNSLAYFLDGIYKDNYRNDKNYQGGKRLIALDIDDQPYTREELENKLEEQNLFGLIYPTAKYYYNESARWRVLLVADEEMNKEQYKHVVDGVSAMLQLDMDEASKKISQLMGYPLSSEHISTIIGTMVNVKQFQPKQVKPQFKGDNVINITHSNKTLLDFNHKQAQLLKQALTTGIPEGSRNNHYRQIVLFLRDILSDESMMVWHEEAQEYEARLKELILSSGIDEKEMELIIR